MITFFSIITLVGLILGSALANCVIIYFTDKEELLRISKKFYWWEKYLIFPLITLYFKIKSIDKP